MYYTRCSHNGERTNGRMEGRGKFTFANGNYYIGVWPLPGTGWVVDDAMLGGRPTSDGLTPIAKGGHERHAPPTVNPPDMAHVRWNPHLLFRYPPLCFARRIDSQRRVPLGNRRFALPCTKESASWHAQKTPM